MYFFKLYFHPIILSVSENLVLPTPTTPNWHSNCQIQWVLFSSYLTSFTHLLTVLCNHLADSPTFAHAVNIGSFPQSFAFGPDFISIISSAIRRLMECEGIETLPFLYQDAL